VLLEKVQLYFFVIDSHLRFDLLWLYAICGSGSIANNEYKIPYFFYNKSCAWNCTNDCITIQSFLLESSISSESLL